MAVNFSSTSVDFRYIGLSLSDEMTQLLLSEFRPYIPAGWTLRATHHTLVHYGDPDWASRASSLIPFVGRSVPISIRSIGCSNKAVAVGIATCVDSSKRVPHITLAFAPGARSVDSNDITDWVDIRPFWLAGTVTVVR